MKEYKCFNCVNFKTPLCELCNSIESPDGEKGKPTYYQAMEGKTIDCVELDNLVKYIVARALAYVPINVNTIMKYNHLVAREEV